MHKNDDQQIHPNCDVIFDSTHVLIERRDKTVAVKMH